MKPLWYSRRTHNELIAKQYKNISDLRRKYEDEIEDRVARELRNERKTLEALINELARVKMRSNPSDYEVCYITFGLPRDTFMRMTDMRMIGHHLDIVAHTIMHKVREQLVEFVRGKI